MTRLVFLLCTGLCLCFPSVHAQQVKLTTSLGEIIVEVNTEKAPKSAENFLTYVRDGYYNGTIFHRVMDGFMIQGGGFDQDFKKKTTRDPIENEANNSLKNLRGTLAMARTGDPHSATAQFFINVVDNAFLDHTAQTRRGWGYAVFAKVVDGMGVVDQIKSVATGNKNGHQNVPTTAVVITSAAVVGE